MPQPVRKSSYPIVIANQRKRTESGGKLGALRSWTRLAVGIAVFSTEAIFDRTRVWERTLKTAETNTLSENAAHKLDREIQPTPPSPEAYALIGLIFDAESKLVRSAETGKRVERLVDHLLSPPLAFLRKRWILKPFYHRFDHWVERGQYEVERWQEIGKIEESHSKELLKAATAVTVDDTIDYLSTNPDLQELVQTQSTSLINELIEEVRERAVTINTVVEGMIRKILGLTPREYIPGPPAEIRRWAHLIPTSMDKRT